MDGTVAEITDRRQRKKQHTRDALIHAALGLFAAKGYEHTAIREITDAVDVSERTFFRYFASKEDLVLSFSSDGADVFAEALAARLAEEAPFTAMRTAFGIALRELAAESAETDHLFVLRLIDETPELQAAHMRYAHCRNDEVVQILAARAGVDPVADRRPRVLAAAMGALVFLAIQDWVAGDDRDPETLIAAFDAYAAEIIPSLTGSWSPA
jgi:AcrR family transcriptional regulator